MGRDGLNTSYNKCLKRFQSTRPRGARRAKPCKQLRNKDVSIHAPTWGATKAILTLAMPLQVSIHAPTWGATSRHERKICDSMLFQSTRPRGARRRPLRQVQAICPSFNPRAHVGRDRSDYLMITEHTGFQSTRPRGARHTTLYLVKLSLCVSIHAPTWGATNLPPVLCGVWLCFNPRAHVGRDLQQRLSARLQDPGFNPRAHVGRDSNFGSTLSRHERFQSTRPRGARHHRETSSK